MAESPRYRRSGNGPPPAAWDDLVRWQQLADTAPDRSVKTAQTWRNGLAGFITLLTSALILKGPDIGAIGSPMKYAVIALLAAGLALTFWGLWAALAAEAPQQTGMSFAKAIAAHGSIAGYEHNIVVKSNERIKQARRRVFGALVALLIGSVCWWLAPTSASGAVMQVQATVGGATLSLCGTPLSSPSGTLLIDVGNSSAPTAIALSTVNSLAIVESCE